MLLDIVNAAQFMGIEGLFQLACKTIALNTIEAMQSKIFNDYEKPTNPISVDRLEQARLTDNMEWKHIERKKEAAHLYAMTLNRDIQDLVVDYILARSALSIFFLLTRSANRISSNIFFKRNATSLYILSCPF